MAETTEKDKADKDRGGGKLGLSSGGGKLSLNKTVEKRQTRQNFSHGRSKMVTVEVENKVGPKPRFVRHFGLERPFPIRG